MKRDIYSAAQLTEFIHEVGFLPLLDSGIQGYSAEEVVSDDCRLCGVPRWRLGLAVVEVERSHRVRWRLRVW